MLTALRITLPLAYSRNCILVNKCPIKTKGIHGRKKMLNYVAAQLILSENS